MHTLPTLPSLCGDIDMRIDAHGVWHYGGSPINREALVRLFASVLHHEDDGYWLITPAEKARIQVDDAPFMAVEIYSNDTNALSVRTNLDETIVIDDEHPIHMIGDIPYVRVRDRLDAKFTRAAYYDLIALGATEVIDGTDIFGLWSDDIFFPLEPIAP